MAARIGGEFVLALLMLVLSYGFWSIVKSPAFFRKVLADPAELRRYVNFVGAEELVGRAEGIKPVAGSYLDNMAMLGRAHFGALSKTRNLLFLGAICILAGSYFIGLRYVIANLIFFILPSLFEIADSAKNYNLTHVYTVLVNLYNWNLADGEGCFRFCTVVEPRFREAYKIVVELGSQTLPF